jgi:murein DD-endopeptidase MepM/ murein hydrolase activator NlpD
MKMSLKNILWLAITSLLLSSCAHNKPNNEASDSTSGSSSLDSSTGRTVASAQDTPTFDWPVDRARMTRGFFINRKRPHLGIDLAAPKGTAIVSAQKGSVIYAGHAFHGFGKMVLIESGNGWATIYAHLDKILVSEGQHVIQGEVLGTMGRTGRATGVHLQFEIRKDKGPIDPLPLLPHGRSVAALGRNRH